LTVGNRHLRAWRLQRAHQRAADGAFGEWVGRAAPPLVALALLPLIRPVFLHFLDDPAELAAGTGGFVARVALLATSLVALDVYGALVRGEDRSVLDLLPVDPAEVVAFELRRVAERHVPWLLAAGVLFAPIVWASPMAGAIGWASVVALWALALPASALAHLGAVHVAEAPGWRPLLELVRGGVPAEQAAFIYAPGVVLAAVGGLGFGVSAGVSAAVAGSPIGGVAPVAALVLAAAAARFVGPLSHRTWARASAIVSDIDARYSALEHQEEGTTVYLDWLVGRLPTRWRPFALKDLRHGWRERRTWIFGAWGLGVAGALAAWTGGVGAGAATALVVALGVAALASVAFWMDRDDPPFLRLFFATDGSTARAARAAVVTAWLAPAAVVPLPALALRRGVWEALIAGGLGGAALIGAVGLAVVAASRGGPALYAPAVTVWLVAGGALVRATGWSG
jgi:hypothetical protein